MAKVIFVSMYDVNVQAQPEKTFVKDGKQTIVPARPASKAKIMIAHYEETIQQFILPESFKPEDFGVKTLSEGDTLTVRCPDLEKVRPFNVYNVDRVIPKGK